MRTLVVSSDGAWDRPDRPAEGVGMPTDDPRPFTGLAAVNDTPIQQLRRHHPSVGAGGNRRDKPIRGGVSAGLDSHILFLCSR